MTQAAIVDAIPAGDDFMARFDGRLEGLLRWSQLDALWDAVRARPTGWFAYFLAEPPPVEPLPAAQLDELLDRLDSLLRREHEHDYCGIVYADNPRAPTLIKVYDPANLGSVCGPGRERILPRWVLSRTAPRAIEHREVTPMNRRRWWRRWVGRG